MTKVAIIVPFFGKVPDYFDIWLLSIKHNPTFDFIFVSDLILDYDIPENMKLIRMSFNELKILIQSKFDFPISIKSPYHLCDFKVAYGLIFSDYLKKYDYWGHCDTDQVFGNMRKFLGESIFANYERIFYLGHLTLYRNNDRINNMFKLPGALFDYKTVYGTDEWYSFGEVSGALQIALRNNISQYSDISFADVMCAYTRLRFYGDSVRPKRFVFYWEDGAVKRAYIDKSGEVKEDEWLYIHLQKRKMKDLRMLKQGTSFYICGHSFVDKKYKGIPTKENIFTLSDYRGAYVEFYEKIRYIFSKLKMFGGCNFAQKKIWIKQRLARPYFLWPEKVLYK